jgi:hypothetical protein
MKVSIKKNALVSEMKDNNMRYKERGKSITMDYMYWE